MRITYLSGTRIPTEKASGLAIMRQCEAFVALGHSVTLLRPRRHNPAGNDAFAYYGLRETFVIRDILTFDRLLSLGKIGFILMRIPLLALSAWYVWWHRHTIEVLYSRDPWLLLLPLWIVPNERIVLEIHTKHTNWVTRRVVSSVGTCVVISEGLREWYGPIRGTKSLLLEPSGVDTAQFQSLAAVAETRRALQLSEGTTIVGYVGTYTTMGEEKGVKELIVAFGALWRHMPEAHLLMVGPTGMEQQLIDVLCRNEGIPTHAYTIRELDPKLFAQYLHASDVLVMNYPDTEHYRSYMSPSKLFAYLASGKVIVSSDLPSIRSVAGSEHLIFSKPGNTQSLHLALEHAIETMGAYDSKAAVGIVSQYSWFSRGERIAKQVSANI